MLLILAIIISVISVIINVFLLYNNRIEIKKIEREVEANSDSIRNIQRHLYGKPVTVFDIINEFKKSLINKEEN